MNKQYILVTNWDTVDSDDWYLSDENKKNELKENGDTDQYTKALALQKEDKLYEAFIVGAVDYAIYYQMDSNKVFINRDWDIILEAGSSVISNEYKEAIEYEY